MAVTIREIHLEVNPVQLVEVVHGMCALELKLYGKGMVVSYRR